MSGKAQVLLVGCGGVGTIAALNLETGGHAAVTAVLRSNYSRKPSKVVNTNPTQSEMCFDYVVVTTKNTPDHPPTMADLIESAIVPGETVIVLIQNGLDIEKSFLEKYPDNICLSGVSLIGSHETAPAVIEHEDPDRLIIGAFQNPRLQNETGDAIAHQFVNISTLLRPAMQEVVAAAKAAGVILPLGIEDRMINIDPLTMYLRPSMLEDVQKGTLVEFETLVGEPLREGLSRGVSMPTLTVLYHTLKAMQWRLKERRGIINVPTKGEYLKNGSK